MKIAKLFSILWVVVLLLSGEEADSQEQDCSQTVIPNGCGKGNCSEQCETRFGGIGLCIPEEPTTLSTCACFFDCH
ncbi:hypothetical protein ACP275_11G095200 [Erythranthe tilingii]